MKFYAKQFYSCAFFLIFILSLYSQTVLSKLTINEAPDYFYCSKNMVNMGNFEICKYEVTQAEYKAIMTDTYFYFGKELSDTQRANYPTEMVSWYDAIKFCNKLSEIEGLTPCYIWTSETPTREYVVLYNVMWNKNANGYRLPTKEEWLFVAEKESTLLQDKNMTLLQNTTTDFWNSTNSKNRTQPVGTSKADSNGLFDLKGNVWEWCWDLAEFPWSNRVVCGGAFDSDPENCGAQGVINNDPFYRYNSFGFRVVRNSIKKELQEFHTFCPEL